VRKVSHVRHRVEHALDGRPDPALWPTTTRSSGLVRCAREIEEVSALGVVELECTRERLEDALRNAARVAALEARVVVDADPGEEGDFLPAKSGDASVPPEGAQTRLLRRDLGSPGGEELADLAPGVHSPRVAPLRSR
jgi:hypothetical protein